MASSLVCDSSFYTNADAYNNTGSINSNSFDMKTYEFMYDYTNCKCNETRYPESLVAVYEYFPSLRFLYTDYEISYRPSCDSIFPQCNYYLAPLAAFLYLLFLYFGKKFMKNRKAFDLRNTLKLWNLSLSIFSFIGMIRVVSHLFLVLHLYGFEVSLCSPPGFFYSDGVVGLWIFLFVYSKYIELIDTVFIILRKKNLLFLHYYHHASVLIYSWDAYAVEQPASLYFVAMNYSVHTIMYFYYFLSAQLKRPLSWGVFVTITQLSQMFIGVGVTVTSLCYAYTYNAKYIWNEHEATNPLSYGVFISKKNLLLACLMYSTYLYLFAEFFVKRYIRKSTRNINNKTIVSIKKYDSQNDNNNEEMKIIQSKDYKNVEQS